MCEPATILMAVSAGMQMIGSIQGGYQERSAAKANAGIAEGNAEATRQQTALQVAQLGRQKGQMEGAQRTRFAKAGVQLEGSPLEVMADTAGQFGQDIYVTQATGDARAAGFQAEAQQWRDRGNAAVSQGWLGALGKGASAGASLALMGGGAGGMGAGGAGAGGAGAILNPGAALTPPPRVNGGGWGAGTKVG